MSGMYADLSFIASLEHLTILLDIIVVSNTFPVKTGVMAGFQHLDREALVAARCRAMNDNKVDFSHTSLNLK